MKTKTLLFCLIALIACSTEDPKPLTSESIIGTWGLKSEVYSKCANPADNWSEVSTCPVYCRTFQFLENESYVSQDVENGLIVDSVSGTYNVSGGILVISSVSYTLSLKGSTMVWTSLQGGCTFTVTFSKK